MNIRFTRPDYHQMEALGIDPEKVLDQVNTFRKSDFFVRLNRPCTLGDGVKTIDPEDAPGFIALHEKASRDSRFMKFVPASGAATRMFQSLLQIYYLPQYLERDELERRVSQEVAIACDFVRFIEELHQFAFFDDLREILAGDGFELEEVVQTGQYRLLLDYLLTDSGLGYGFLPKALLKFHAYPEENRTAFEEQLAESMYFLGNKSCKLHFTVPEESQNRFRAHMEAVCENYRQRFGMEFDVCFSSQKPSTNTIAVNLEGVPFRDRFGRLHFRPAGHGALLENLNDLSADLIYIKNVDNVVPDRLKESVCRWKRILGGYLLSVERQIHSLVRRMKAMEGQAVREAAAFINRELLVPLPVGFDMWPEEKRRLLLLDSLDRPIRVCGVVPNSGEPGGAPFWVENENGSISIQIVEKAQVDMDSPEQRQIWKSSTHFNPVDIVCCVRDSEGEAFDLRNYVDPRAVIITRKSKDGQDIQALELPGLWNGSMAHWVSIFVEVPPETFNPVKSVYDLLRPEHQPEGTHRRRSVSSA
ncbi:MAG: DUF4301 family protein [Desulfobacteraceae bacterium]|nr:DUF4301 family protein [Desulfobacteraceae bacterium]